MLMTSLTVILPIQENFLPSMELFFSKFSKMGSWYKPLGFLILPILQ